MIPNEPTLLDHLDRAIYNAALDVDTLGFLQSCLIAELPELVYAPMSRIHVLQDGEHVIDGGDITVHGTTLYAAKEISIVRSVASDTERG